MGYNQASQIFSGNPKPEWHTPRCNPLPPDISQCSSQGRCVSSPGLPQFGGFPPPVPLVGAVEGLTYRAGSPLGNWNGVCGLGDGVAGLAYRFWVYFSRGARSLGWFLTLPELVKKKKKKVWGAWCPWTAVRFQVIPWLGHIIFFITLITIWNCHTYLFTHLLLVYLH